MLKNKKQKKKKSKEMFYNKKENFSKTFGISKLKYKEKWNEILKIFNKSISQKNLKKN